MGVSRPVSRLFDRWALPAFALLSGCDPASGPPPATPEAAVTAPELEGEGCNLALAVEPFGDPNIPLNCHAAPADAICGDACRDAVRACVLSSLVAGRQFTAAWTNEMVDGVGTRRAVVGRLVPVPGAPDDKRVLEITWFELTWATGFDADRATMAKKRARVIRRRCADVTDVVASCDPRLGAPGPRCASRALADDAGMSCEPFDDAPDSVVCAD